MRVKISAAMARQKFHGCDPDYIKNVCHSACCDSSASPTGINVAIHQVELRSVQRRGQRVVRGLLQPNKGERVCPFKTEGHLCGLHETEAKPFGCIASPFQLNTNDTLVIRNRYRRLRCYKDDRDGPAPPAYIAFEASLVLLFGKRTATRIRKHLDAGGGDMYVEMLERSYNMMKDNDQIREAINKTIAEKGRRRA